LFRVNGRRPQRYGQVQSVCLRNTVYFLSALPVNTQRRSPMLSVLHRKGSMVPEALEPVNRLSSIFQHLFNEDVFTPVTTAAPLCVWEDENHINVEVDAPGMKEEDIDITVHNGDLVIRGERKCERKGNGYDTRQYGRFEQRISLPAWAKADQVNAK